MGLRVIGLCIATCLVTVAAQARSPGAEQWYGSFVNVEDLGAALGGHGRQTSRDILTITPDSCIYENQHPHGDQQLKCDARPQGNHLDVYFKSCADEGFLECDPKAYNTSPLFTLTQLRHRLITHWGQLKLTMPRREGVYFRRGPAA